MSDYAEELVVQIKPQKMVTELQSRELEKNAHLRWKNIKPNIDTLDIEIDHLEQFTKDDGNRYARILGGDDPLDRGGEPALTPGDLLPIQQLSRMDNDMLHSAASSKPVRLAAEVWQDHEQNQSRLWNQGCSGVREYIDADELAQWLRHNEPGVNKEYSQKSASRTIDALTDLTKDRLYVKRKNRRKDGFPIRNSASSCLTSPRFLVKRRSRRTLRRQLMSVRSDVPGS
ncbi:hypothetical protein [Halalkalicoccus subterraneus]|uniref:hypothetical protein n=1 Tax=Halalkalicoccus subterraneus TaxID=2675002 RepID=UPI001FE2E70D|nr:hypothetical protein [Halalkalicoccus subterraneus]